MELKYPLLHTKLPNAFLLLQNLISGHSRSSHNADKAVSLKPKSPAQAPEIEELNLTQPRAQPQLRQGPAPSPGPNGTSNAITNIRPPQAAAETAAAENAAQTLAAALNSGQHNEAITDPRLNVSFIEAHLLFLSMCISGILYFLQVSTCVW